jgi:methionine-rich copper-binding protein CopC
MHRFPIRSLFAALAVAIAVATIAAFDGDDQQKPAPAAAAATAAGSERISVPFSDPARPGRLIVQLVTGSIHVKGYDGKEVIVESRAQEEEGRDSERERDRERDREREAERRGDSRSGLHRIPNRASGMTIEEQNNEMRVSADPNKDIVISIQVPSRTTLKLSTVNGGDIIVDRVEGDLEASNTNGDVTLTNVSGTGVVHSVNGELKASFVRVTGKPMSFTTLNGDVDVSLPSDIKADVRLDSGQGDIYTDFPIDMMPVTLNRTVEDNRSKGGKYRIKVEKSMLGKINGGGTEYTFKTFNGDIHLRRAQGGAAQ